MAATTSRRPGAEMHRVTRGGRKLRYLLTVIQEPERARACGSGAKSSADRRPVDPPPVVELRIFEGEEGKEEDITFAYDANFFLFATLETARPMANGRVHPAPPQIPVLTGMPVSGMAYLDRPTEAGYFIFPDLSVRHEGKYFLSFNLYEETKEVKDQDPETNEQKKPKGPGVPGSPDSSFDWRLEVKSDMFTVFSAKKFPGLAESTPLSRTVAEQGCRVRIRRDVRMRRRDKAPSEYEDHHDDGYARPGRGPEQAQDAYPRSPSHSPIGEQGREQQRRMSGEYQQPYNSQYPSPTAPHTAPGPQGFLGFGNSSGSQYQAPPPQFAQPPPPPPPPAPQSYHAPSQAPYHTAPPPYQNRPPPPPPPPSSYSYDRQQHPQSAYPSNPPREHHDSYEADAYRRASVGFPAPNPQHGNPYPGSEANHRPYHGFAPRAPSPGLVNLAPLKTVEPHSGPLASVNRIAPPLPSPAFDRNHERPGQYGQYITPMPASTPEPARNGKRTYDSVFNSSSSHQPLYNHQRPTSAHHDPGLYEDEDEDDALAREQMKMSYKRADGTSLSRPAPVMQ